MTRIITVGAAQMGPIGRHEPRTAVVERLVALLHRGHARGCQLVAFPELALTTFFPRWYFDDPRELESFFEAEMPGPATEPLFAEAARLGIGFHLGFAERAVDGHRIRRFNSAILVDGSGRKVGKYRKIHVPGHAEPEPARPFQHLEKRYFETGDLGFRVFEAFGGRIGMLICNDRRWSESYRVLGLQDAELILIGYNTPIHYPPVPQHDHLQGFHNHLVMQAGAYQNGAWVVGIAKCGREEGCDLLGQSCIIAPTGEIVAQATTLGDELIIADCDLDRCAELRRHMFDFALHRQPQHYGLITAAKAGTKGAKAAS